ncbi:hypothetical protein TRSC58_07413 [Trypanosoma rangeli SC58]|nr:hypothetical protein TRSC58_07413 [Trypanosoma rangeli SC58]
MQRLEVVWPAPPAAAAAAGATTEGEWMPPTATMATATVPLLEEVEAEAPPAVDVDHGVDDEDGEDEEEHDAYEAEVVGNEGKNPRR